MKVYISIEFAMLEQDQRIKYFLGTIGSGCTGAADYTYAVGQLARLTQQSRVMASVYRPTVVVVSYTRGTKEPRAPYIGKGKNVADGFGISS